MKSQAQFTPHKIETWQAALCTFDHRDVNLAILQIGLSADPFPDLGKLMIRCETMRRERLGNMPQDGVKILAASTIRKVAETMQLDLPEDYR